MQGKKSKCLVGNEYEVCETVNGYLKYRSVPEEIIPTSVKRDNSERFLTEARKTRPGALLALTRRLKRHEKEGVPYSAINQYFRGELSEDDGPFGTSYIRSLLTYDPRSETPLTYAQVFASLQSAPSSFDWTSLWDIIEGLEYD